MLSYKGNRIVVPQILQKLLQIIHIGHLGIAKCQTRAKVAADRQFTDMIEHRSVCQEHKKAQPREPMLLSQQPVRPWQKLGSDLFELNGKHYILIVDYTIPNSLNSHNLLQLQVKL